MIARGRADLRPDSPEFQGAVLLLLVRDVGMNVDRLVLRSRLPRDFVARCLRRLADNAVWVDGEVRTTWGEEPTACEEFWLDVEVALGRCLRRINDEGQPEWAPAGEWVKDFDYRGSRTDDASTANAYYQIAPHDPEPEPAGPEEAGDATAEPDVAPPVASLPVTGPPRAVRQTPRASLLRRAARPNEPDPVFQASNASAQGMLVDGWSDANWLG